MPASANTVPVAVADSVAEVSPSADFIGSFGPVRTLSCCCCGESVRGRQWWNRDAGFGVCVPCVALVRSRGESYKEVACLYGIEGVHYGVAE